MALQVTSPTRSYSRSENSTDGQIEPETVGDKGRIHPPPGSIHQDDNLEDDDLKAHHSSGSEKLDLEDLAPTPDSQITIDN